MSLRPGRGGQQQHQQAPPPATPSQPPPPRTPATNPVQGGYYSAYSYTPNNHHGAVHGTPSIVGRSASYSTPSKAVTAATTASTTTTTPSTASSYYASASATARAAPRPIPSYTGAASTNSNATPAVSSASLALGGNAGSGYGGSFGTTQPAGTSYSQSAYGGYHNIQQSKPELRKSRPKHRMGASSSGGYGITRGITIPTSFTALLSDLRVWSTLFSLFCLCGVLYYRGQVRTVLKASAVSSVPDLLHHLEHWKVREQQSSTSIRTMKDSLRIANEHKGALEKENRNHLQTIQERDRTIHESREQLQRLAIRDEAWKEMMNTLQATAQRSSRRAVTEKFGSGPYQVEFAIVIPTLDDTQGQQRYFVVEMAPLEFMPHTVHVFLEQVSHGLWNNAWFYINGPHVLQAGPQAQSLNDGEDPREVALRPFVAQGLESVAYPEYSNEFPHRPWTLGLTGRPGGPDFYINKMDNSKAHGPGGQYHNILPEFADPCFAIVVKGFDTLEAMAQSPTITDERNDYRFFYTQPIRIVNVTILPHAITPDVEGAHQREQGFANIPLAMGGNTAEAHVTLQKHFSKLIRTRTTAAL